MSTAAKTIGELVSDLLAKRDQIDLAELALKQQKEVLSGMEKELSELMNDEGCQSFRSSDGRLVYKSRDIFVNVPAANRGAVVEACRAMGLDDLVKTEVPTASLKSRVREWMGDLGDEEQIPETLRPLIVVHEEFSVRVRKS